MSTWPSFSAKMPATSLPHSPWFRIYRPRPAATARLICLPHAGGSAGFYRTWAELMPDEVELVAVQLPGREERTDEAVIDTMPTLVDALATAMPVMTDRPYLLFGHSMGAAVAYELCVELQRRTQRLPCHLVVSAREAPRRQQQHSLHLAGDDALLAELHRLGGTPAALLESEEFRALLLPRMRGDYRLIETYEPSPSPAVLPLSISAFVGSDDHELSQAEAEAWSEQTSQVFQLRRFRGDHFYLQAQAKTVIQALLPLLGVAGHPAQTWPSAP